MDLFSRLIVANNCLFRILSTSCLIPMFSKGIELTLTKRFAGFLLISQCPALFRVLSSSPLFSVPTCFLSMIHGTGWGGHLPPSSLGTACTIWTLFLPFILEPSSSFLDHFSFPEKAELRALGIDLGYQLHVTSPIPESSLDQTWEEVLTLFMIQIFKVWLILSLSLQSLRLKS